MSGYEFRIIVDEQTVNCEYDGPGVHRQQCDEGTINRAENLEIIEVLEQWLKRWEWIAKHSEKGRLLVPDTFKVLGDQLWKLAFSGDVGIKLLVAREDLAGQDEESDAGIRVRISFTERARDLAGLPWEFVRFPGDGVRKEFFLASETRLVLGRYVDGVGNLDIRPADKKVRILFVISLPDKPEHERERADFGDLVTELQDLPEAVEIKCVNGWEPRKVEAGLAEFRAEGNQVDIVHVLGACKEVKGRAQLYLPDASGGAAWVDPQELVETLTRDRWNRPALVVLHLSDWEDESAEHFEQLAPAFVKAEIAAVLAMQYPMPMGHGMTFVKNIYEKLAKGSRIGDAVQNARYELGGLNRQFGTPVLYMQSALDGVLIRTTLTGVPESSGPHGITGAREPVAPGSFRPAGVAVTEVLLKALDGVRPQPDDTQDFRDWRRLRDWVRSEIEPSDDVPKVRQRIKALRRDHQDNLEVQRLSTRLLGQLDRLAGSG